MKNIIMPKLSDTMTEGLLGSWLKNVGDTISRGDVIAEVETDKATMGLESFDDGVLLEKRVEAGSTVPVGTVLGVMGMPGEMPAARPEMAAAAEIPPATPVPSTSEVPDQAESPVASGEKASPVVRRRARELGIDLETVQGSGSGGRVLLEDLQQAVGVTAAAVVEEEQATEEQATEEQATEEQATEEQATEEQVVVPRPLQSHKRDVEGGVSRQARMRGAIASTVSTAWREIPHYYVTMEISMDNAEEIRRELQMTGSSVSVNDLILKGVAITLAKFPNLNAIYTDAGAVQQKEINLGIAVNVTGGLVVPVLKGAGSMTLVEVAQRSRELVELARDGRLTPGDMSGGSFSISNLGPMGVSQFSAIILPPQVAILAVGAVGETVIARSGEMVVGRIMRVTLSADHRAVDGAYAASFLQELKAVLENPVRLLI